MWDKINVARPPVDLSYALRSPADTDDGPVAFGIGRPTWSYLCSVKQGHSVNCGQWSDYCVHACGTHTETYGHLTSTGKPTVADVLDSQHVPMVLPCLVITVLPTTAVSTTSNETGNSQDQVVTLEGFMKAYYALPLEDTPVSGMKAVFIRTGLRPTQYSGTNPPYIHHHVMNFMVNTLQCKHVLVDLPSVDREQDGGRLLAHRAFFRERSDCTVTELCRNDTLNEMDDGWYALNLQLLRWHVDAVPSRPVLYHLKRE